jgi:hypothetical protein
MMVFCADNEVKMTALYLLSTSVHFEYYFSALLFSNEFFCIFVCEMEVRVSAEPGVRTFGARSFPSLFLFTSIFLDWDTRCCIFH